MRAYLKYIFALATLSAVAGCAAPIADLAIRDVSVIDVEAGRVVEHQTVLVSGSVIAAVGPVSVVRGRASKLIDGRGLYLIPGLWDSHTHVSKARETALPMMVAYGVTTARDLGGDMAELVRWRRDINQGSRIGPTLLIAGPYLESPATMARILPRGDVEPYGRTRWAVESDEEARQRVDEVIRQGGDFIKVRTIHSKEVFKAIAAAAEARGLRLATHANDLTVDEMIEAGVDSIEHMTWIATDRLTPEQQRQAGTRLAEAGIAVTPTLAAFSSTFDHSTEEFARLIAQPPREWDHSRNLLSAFLIEDWNEQVAERTHPLDGLKKFIDRQADVYKAFKQAGVLFLAGTDLAVLGIYPGESLHEELRLLVDRLGFTSAEALQAATMNPARFVGRGASFGSIAAGKVADVVLLKGNPLEDIRNTSKIAAVILRGDLFDQRRLEATKRRVSRSPILRRNDWR